MRPSSAGGVVPARIRGVASQVSGVRSTLHVSMFGKELPGCLDVPSLHLPVAAAHVVPQVVPCLPVDVADKTLLS